MSTISHLHHFSHFFPILHLIDFAFYMRPKNYLSIHSTKLEDFLLCHWSQQLQRYKLWHFRTFHIRSYLDHCDLVLFTDVQVTENQILLNVVGYAQNIWQWTVKYVNTNKKNIIYITSNLKLCTRTDDNIQTGSILWPINLQFYKHNTTNKQCTVTGTLNHTCVNILKTNNFFGKKEILLSNWVGPWQLPVLSRNILPIPELGQYNTLLNIIFLL